MPTDFPGAIDALPRPGASTKRNATGFELHNVIDNISDAIEAIETVLGAGITTPNGVMRKLAEASGSGASGVIEFASIPATYRTLLVQFMGRSDLAGTAAAVRLTFETSPTAGAYNHQQLRGNGATASASENAGASDWIQVGVVTGSTGSASCVGSGNIWIPNYALTSLFKSIFAQGMVVTTLGASGLFNDLYSGIWESTAAIDRIRLTLAGGNWTTTSRVTLYGIPG